MGQESSIQWTEATWNPWHGCRKVSAGCKYCYMMRDKIKYGQDPTLVQLSKTKFNDPLKWKEGKLIFTCSWSDWFIEEADLWRDEAWEIIRLTPHHTYQILTKRTSRIIPHLPFMWGNRGWENIWLGTSVEEQKVDNRIRELLEVPAAVHFLSCEPLIGPLNLDDYLYSRYTMGGNRHMYNQVEWVIIGGESGNDNGDWKYRECKLEWIESLVHQCEAAGVPVFVKQLGTHLAKKMGLKDRHGGDITEWPEHLRIRQMPKIYDTPTTPQQLLG
jgi:protein gp37